MGLYGMVAGKVNLVVSKSCKMMHFELKTI